MALVDCVVPMWGVIPDLIFSGNAEGIPQAPKGARVILMGFSDNPTGEFIAENQGKREVYNLKGNKASLYWTK